MKKEGAFICKRLYFCKKKLSLIIFSFWSYLWECVLQVIMEVVEVQEEVSKVDICYERCWKSVLVIASVI